MAIERKYLGMFMFIDNYRAPSALVAVASGTQYCKPDKLELELAQKHCIEETTNEIKAAASAGAWCPAVCL